MPTSSPVSYFEDIRLSRVAPTVLTCAVAWTGFGVYYLLSDRVLSGCHCVAEGVLGLVLAYFALRDPTKRKRIAKYYVASLLIGLTLDACFSGVEVALAPMFFCCAALGATLTLGSRAVRMPVVVGLLLILAINYVFPHLLPSTPGPRPLDRMLGYMTLLGVVAACVLFAESTAEVFANRLAQATSDLREHTAALDRVAGVDPLTSLPNRRRFREDVSSLIETCTADRGFVLLLLDLNGFKQVNDRYGHCVGDQLLCDFADQLRDAFSDSTDVYRIGSDEFVAVLPGSQDALEHLVADAESRISKVSGRSYIGENQVADLSCSVGVALFPHHAATLDDLVSGADKALYEAKATKSKQLVTFEPWMSEVAEKKRQMLDALNDAIERDEFTLHFQPQVDVDSTAISGAEALLRWNMAGKPISPAEFIPYLEESGKIVEVGNWVLRTACRQLAEWRSNGFPIRMSVNVSALQVQRKEFGEFVEGVLRECELPGSALDLEITESMLLDRDEVVRQNIEQLARKDVRFSIDDFGTGYSSLSYLKKITVDRLKIDRSFIMDIPGDDDGIIAETIIALGKSLEMTIVAEGVETAYQLDFLKERCCDEYQGYFFSKPVPAQDFGQLLASHSSPAAVGVGS